MSDLNLQPLSQQRVRIYISPDVAYDLKKMAKVTANVLGKLGCGNCHSGRILEFHMIEDYIINAKLEPEEIVGGRF